MLRAVLDPNVFVSAAIAPTGTPARLVEAAFARQFVLIACPHLIDELDTDAGALAGLLDRTTGVPRAPLPGDEAAETIFARIASPQGLTAQVATFGRREVIQAIGAALPEGGDVADILALAERFLASEHVVALGAGR